MASSRGQVLKRDYGFLVRVFVGRDATGKRKYQNQKVTGTKKDAEKVLTAMLRKLDTGELLIEPTRMSVKSYLMHWLKTAAEPRLDASSYTEYAAMMRRYIYEPIGDVLLTKLEPIQIQQVYSGMLERGLSPRVVRYTHAVLSSALKQAVKWRMASRNPAQFVDLPKQAKLEMKAMSEAETSRFLKAAKGNRHYVLFSLMLGTGLRPSEVIALKWVDLDVTKGNLSVQRVWGKIKGGGYGFKPPKTKRSRRSIKLPDDLVRLLLAHKDRQPFDSELIFPSENDTPLNESNLVNRDFKPLLKAAGLDEKIRLYDLRHTHATLLLKAGVHPKIVSERLGHSSITLTLDTYSHVLPGMQDEAADKLNTMIFGGDEAPQYRAVN